MRAPKGVFPGWVSSSIGAQSKYKFRATGEFRAPKRGEYYLSGAIVEAYQAPNDLAMPFWIARLVSVVKCTHCEGTGQTAEQYTHRQKCPECKREVYTVPAEGVPDQMLRGCPLCDAVFWEQEQ